MVTKLVARLCNIKCHLERYSRKDLTANEGFDTSSTQPIEEVADRCNTSHHPSRYALCRRHNPLSFQQACNKASKLDRYTVCDKVSFSASPLIECKCNPFADVRNMRCGGKIVTAIDPGQLTCLGGRCDLWQRLRIIAAPDESRAKDNDSKILGSEGESDALRFTFRARIRARRSVRERMVFRCVDQRPAIQQNRFGADMHSSRDSGRASGLEYVTRASQIGAVVLCFSTTVIGVRCSVDESLTAFHPFDQPHIEQVARKRHRAQGLHYLKRTLTARESHHLKTLCDEMPN